MTTAQHQHHKHMMDTNKKGHVLAIFELLAITNFNQLL